MTGRHIFIRSSLTVALPFILIWAFVETLFREMRSACWHARLEVRANIEAYRREIRRKDY